MSETTAGALVQEGAGCGAGEKEESLGQCGWGMYLRGGRRKHVFCYLEEDERAFPGQAMDVRGEEI